MKAILLVELRKLKYNYVVQTTKPKIQLYNRNYRGIKKEYISFLHMRMLLADLCK